MSLHLLPFRKGFRWITKTNKNASYRRENKKTWTKVKRKLCVPILLCIFFFALNCNNKENGDSITKVFVLVVCECVHGWNITFLDSFASEMTRQNAWGPHYSLCLIHFYTLWTVAGPYRNYITLMMYSNDDGSEWICDRICTLFSFSFSFSLIETNSICPC